MVADIDRAGARVTAEAVGGTAVPLDIGEPYAWRALVGALEHRRARFGMQTMCEWGGMANATIIERI